MVDEKIIFDIEELPSFNYTTSRFIEGIDSKKHMKEELIEAKKIKEDLTVNDVAIIETNIYNDYVSHVHKLYHNNIQEKYDSMNETLSERQMTSDKRAKWRETRSKEEAYKEPFNITSEDFKTFMRVTDTNVYEYSEEDINKLKDPKNISRLYNELNSLHRYGSLKELIYTVKDPIQKSKAENLLKSVVSSYMNYLSDSNSIIPNRNLENTKILYNKAIEIMKETEKDPTSLDPFNKQKLVCITELFTSLNAIFNHENEIKKHIKLSGIEIEESQENVKAKHTILKEENPIFDLYNNDLFSDVSRDISSYVKAVKDILPVIKIDENGDKKPYHKIHEIQNCLIEERETGLNIYDKILYEEISSIFGKKKAYSDEEIKEIKKYGKEKIIDIHYDKKIKELSSKDKFLTGIPGRKTRSQLREALEKKEESKEEIKEKQKILQPYIYDLYGKPTTGINEEQYTQNKISEYFKLNKQFMDDLGNRANGIHELVNSIFTPVDVYDLEKMMEDFGFELDMI